MTVGRLRLLAAGRVLRRSQCSKRARERRRDSWQVAHDLVPSCVRPLLPLTSMTLAYPFNLAKAQQEPSLCVDCFVLRPSCALGPTSAARSTIMPQDPELLMSPGLT